VQNKIKETPLMKQYNQIKEKHPDALLLFRVGDFYETFGEDAIKAASILGIVLTKRGAGSASETPLAGFPYHSLDTYLPKLVKAGYRVAICDQLENPKLTKEIVKRGVTELVTPGVAMNDAILDHKKNNYLCAVFFGKKNIGISFIDISTGDFWVGQGTKNIIAQFLQNFIPSEILVAKPHKKIFEATFGSQFPTFFVEDWVFENDFANEKLTSHFETNSLSGFGINDLFEGSNSAGAILHYLYETQQKRLKHITKIQRLVSSDYVWMDDFTIRNLELFYPSNIEGVSLISILDHTQTSMGARRMKHWLAFPSKDIKEINLRQQIVSSIINVESVYLALKDFMPLVIDLERVMAKISTYKVAPRTLVQLNSSLNVIPNILDVLNKSGNKNLKNNASRFPSIEGVVNLLSRTLDSDAPASINKGNVIAKGVSDELDELRNLLSTTKLRLDNLLKNEINLTKISSLKIAFNNVFGYYIEVRNTHKDKVPERWVRKQTLVNAERYITDELKEFESKIFGAEDKIKILEESLYEKLLNELQSYLDTLKLASNELSFLDCLWSFSFSAKKHNYVCPKFIDENSIFIEEGRHPVIEQKLSRDSSYVPNTVTLNDKDQQLIMITGPNMSGKSALLRQTALITIMGQMGSYVPAKSVEMGIVDKIFTRVGASDNISKGASTFMVEMNESATILNNVTKQSLILLDEIGRGTSTYDGISIAWAIAQFLHEHPYKPKVLFATHYHELNAMSQQFPRIKNHNVSVKELKNKVLFLRKLEPGGSAHSFGIHVAKMAGMPKIILQTAAKKLKALESSHALEERTDSMNDNKSSLQMTMFKLDDPLLEQLRDEINELDINSLTPIEALMKLNEIKRRLGIN
jgi:DNA mismatch repair protein MutS|tara:strand:- start:86 stop:2686 length:2601 start_codon:yes stop_codon:yes gene_type:complete